MGQRTGHLRVGFPRDLSPDDVTNWVSQLAGLVAQWRQRPPNHPRGGTRGDGDVRGNQPPPTRTPDSGGLSNSVIIPLTQVPKPE
jgi:hypothetical protein